MLRSISGVLTYKIWNEMLFNHFFGDHKKNQVVYLYVTEDLIAEIGEKQGLEYKDALTSFTKAVNTYERGNIDTIFKKAKIWGRKWYQQGQLGVPPFIGILSMCVLAASRMNNSEGVTSGNYYYRLRELLDENESMDRGPIKHFKETEKLWIYLNEWLKGMNGALGYINVFQFGQRYIGYPRSQCLIRESDRKDLYDFFHWSGFRPYNDIEINELKERLMIFLHNKNNQLARYFKESQSHEGLEEEFIKMILTEFRSWDGNGILSFTKNKRKLHKDLLLHIWFEKIEGPYNAKINIDLFCNVEDEVDETFTSIYPFEKVGGYLKKHVSEIQEIKSDPNFDIGKKKHIKLSHETKDIYLFERGEYSNLTGWIQTKELMLNQVYLLLFNSSKLNNIQEWIQSNNLVYREFSFENLNQQEWNIFYIELNDVQPKYLYKLENDLHLNNNEISISWEGGLKLHHNEWLFDALPTLTIKAKKNTEVSIDNTLAFCMLESKISVPLEYLNLKEPRIYEFSVAGVSQSILLKNDYKNYIDFQNFVPEQHDLNVKKIKIAGTYIYDNENNIEFSADPFIQTGQGEAQVAYRKNQYNTVRFKPNLNAPAYARSKYQLGINFHQFDSILLDRPIELLLEYMTIKKEGSWQDFLKAIQYLYEDEINSGENKSLIAFSIRRNLVKLGMVEFFKEPYQSKFFWKVNPTSVALIPSSTILMTITGGRTRRSLKELNNSLPDEIKLICSVPTDKYEPTPFYLESELEEVVQEYLNKNEISYNWGEDYFSYHLLRILPTLNELVYSVDSVPSDSIPPSDIKEYWDPNKHCWSDKRGILQRIHFNDFSRNTYLFDQNPEQTRPIDKEIGKIFAAQRARSAIFLYSPYQLFVRREYHLPDLYERCITSCSGKSPIEQDNFRLYENVPFEIAISLSVKLGFKLEYL
ncbi:MAG: hypothetical protein ACQET6_07540 [Bacillota bacterium]